MKMLLSTLNKFISPENIRRKVLGERGNKRTQSAARKDLGLPIFILDFFHGPGRKNGTKT